MRNRLVGWLVVAIAGLIGFIIFAFNRALAEIVNETCSHGPECTMWTTIDFHTNVSIAITTLIFLAGLALIFFGEKKGRQAFDDAEDAPAPSAAASKERYEKVLAELNADEKKALEAVISSQGTIFQSDLVEKTGFTKVKVTRILDRLEGQGVVERKRRGMTNVVILKP